MRAITPQEPDAVSPNSRKTPKPLKIFNFRLPLGMRGKGYILRMVVETAGPGPEHRRFRDIVAAILITAVLVVVVTAGVLFLIYLAKNLMGIDLFQTGHLID